MRVRVAILAFVVACATTAPPSTAPPRVTPAEPSPHAISEAGSDAGSDNASDAGSDDGSDVTVLHAKRWVYASYFNHLKHAIYAEWKPSTVWKAISPADRPNLDTLTTEVRITLAPDGSVSTVDVTKPCGVPAIDREGVRAVTAAGPYSNPPAGLVKDGMIAFPFAFYFEVKSAGP